MKRNSKWRERISVRKIMCALAAIVPAALISIGVSEALSGLVAAVISAIAGIVCYFTLEVCTGDGDEKRH